MDNDIKDLEMFKYFLECYFHVDISYSELDDVIREFKQSELSKYSAKLLEEAMLLK
ncbi:MAG TPA: hypothetical protein PLA01_06055 [Acetivibrio sp.]|nr:hypothetical protein [Acetivibrio sp.]